MAATPASAIPFPFSLPLFNNAELDVKQEALIEELKSKYVPKIESILFPEQEARFEQAIRDGDSLRKAFRSMALTPRQKSELAATMKTMPAGRLLAALTPEQRKEIFMNKEMFAPTADEIAERVKAGMESKAAFSPDALGSDMSPTPEEIAEKIKLGFERKKAFMPSPKEIQERISAKVEAMAE
ncbi:MAG: hypothetical protein WBB18_18270 [Nodosilinea sp.]